jgi:hypothetical protein
VGSDGTCLSDYLLAVPAKELRRQSKTHNENFILHPPHNKITTDTCLAAPATYVLGLREDIICDYPSLNHGFAKLAVALLYGQLRQASFEHHLLCTNYL